MEGPALRDRRLGSAFEPEEQKRNKYSFHNFWLGESSRGHFANVASVWVCVAQ